MAGPATAAAVRCPICRTGGSAPSRPLPPVGALFGDGAFGGVAAPAQIHRLDADRILRRPWHADNIERLMGNKGHPVVHPNAHHFAFISPFPEAMTDEIGAPARDPEGFDRRAFLSRIDRRILDFFNTVLPDEG